MEFTACTQTLQDVQKLKEYSLEKLPLYPNSTSQSEIQGVQLLKSYLCTQAQQIRQEELLLEYYAERALPSLRKEAND